MRRNLRILAGVLFFTVVLAGCQSSGIRDGIPSLDGSPGRIEGPSRADIYVELAAEYLRAGQMEAALVNARKAVAADGNSSNAHYILGLVSQTLGDIPQALQSFKRAIGINAGNSAVVNAYASLLCSQGRYEEADKYFQHAVANPLYATPWVPLTNAGSCAIQGGKADAGEDYLRRALQQKGDYSPALLSMAQLSLDRRNWLSARAYVQRFSAATSHTAKSLWIGIQAERQLGGRDEEASYAMLLRAKFPDSNEAKLLEGRGSQ